MRKVLKVCSIIIIVLAITIGIDLLCIKLMKRPAFAIIDDNDSVNTTYKGLIYDTYYCFNDNTINVKGKTEKFVCPETSEIYGIIKEVSEKYIVIVGIDENMILAPGDVAHISLSNNPTIQGSESLKVAQKVKIIANIIQETYPLGVIASSITVINSMNFVIIDESPDALCAEALEEFYQQGDYIYYWPCIKNNRMIVKYSDGSEETVSKALQDKHITIEDVMNSGFAIKEKNNK